MPGWDGAAPGAVDYALANRAAAPVTKAFRPRESRSCDRRAQLLRCYSTSLLPALLLFLGRAARRVLVAAGERPAL